MPDNKNARPFMQFNFRVSFGGVEAGFQEVSGIGTEVTVAEYRNGNELENNVRKLTGLNKATDITLKRGVTGAKELYKWMDEVRSGTGEPLKLVTIELLSASREKVMAWNLSNARIIKLTFGPLNAKGTDVAMEEMVIAYERVTLE